MACCNMALALYRDEDDLRLWQKYVVESKSQALFLMGHIQAFIGQFEYAIESCSQSEKWARKSGCSMSVNGAATFKAIFYYHQQDRIGVSGEYTAKVKGVREPEWLEGDIVSLDDWANNEHDFAIPFYYGFIAVRVLLRYQFLVADAMSGISRGKPQLCCNIGW